MTLELMQECYLDDYAISKIPISAYSNLCNCVFCWEYIKVKICKTCNKLFCSEHKEDHFCFKEIIRDSTSENKEIK